MPVNKKRSNLVHDFTDPASAPPDPQMKRGRIIVATGVVMNDADDSDGSTFYLLDLPSHCLLHPDTFFDVENDGYAQIVIGTATDPDALVDVARADGTQIDPIAKGDAFHGKYLWEILGLAEDPGGTIALWKHATADATAAGNMPFQIHYIAP